TLNGLNRPGYGFHHDAFPLSCFDDEALFSPSLPATYRSASKMALNCRIKIGFMHKVKIE
ncbi:MAG TPA: hypothetical protein VGD13_10105, partial [Xanthobacteraceae bacterium]